MSDWQHLPLVLKCVRCDIWVPQISFKSKIIETMFQLPYTVIILYIHIHHLTNRQWSLHLRWIWMNTLFTCWKFIGFMPIIHGHYTPKRLQILVILLLWPAFIYQTKSQFSADHFITCTLISGQRSLLLTRINFNPNQVCDFEGKFNIEMIGVDGYLHIKPQTISTNEAEIDNTPEMVALPARQLANGQYFP